MYLRLRVLFVATFCVAVFALGCVGVERKAASVTKVRVLCYNIHHGEGLDGKLDLERIAKLITESGADLVALQEVDRGAERTKMLDIPAELGRMTGLRPVFRKNHDLNPGEYGNALLSRWPLEDVKNTWLPRLSANEQRGFLQVTIRLGKKRLIFASTHLDHRGNVEEDRLASVAKIRELIAAEKADWKIVAGDFNARPRSKTYSEMAAQFEDAWALVGSGEGFTIPVRRPNSRIDYVWFAGAETLKPVRAEVLQSEASDHLPLLVEFEIKR